MSEPLRQPANAPVSIEGTAVPPVLYEPRADVARDADVRNLVLPDLCPCSAQGAGMPFRIEGNARRNAGDCAPSVRRV
jgi:hypothetical protein